MILEFYLLPHITEIAMKHLIWFSMENNNLCPWAAK